MQPVAPLTDPLRKAADEMAAAAERAAHRVRQGEPCWCLDFTRDGRHTGKCLSLQTALDTYRAAVAKEAGPSHVRPPADAELVETAWCCPRHGCRMYTFCLDDECRAIQWSLKHKHEPSDRESREERGGGDV